MGGLGELIREAGRTFADRTALDAPGRKPLPYGDLPGLVGAVTARLRDRGIGPGDRVAIVVGNGPEAATAFLSVGCAAVCAPLNPAYRESELEFYLSDLRARAVVVGSDIVTPVRNAARAQGIDVLELEVPVDVPSGVFALDGPLGGAAEIPDRDPDDTALLLHTSGTTSRPKLVPLTHRNLSASARNVAETLALRQDDRCLNVMPLFHIHGLVAALLASLAAGGAVACTPGFHPTRVFDWLRTLDPTWMTAVPTMHQAILSRLDEHEDALRDHRLRFVRSSSASLPVPVFEQLEDRLGIPVIEAYGMTEAAHQMASNLLPPGRRLAGSVGPAAGPEITILAADGTPLPAGVVGEIAIRGENVFQGYEANPEANAVAFVDGWFRTGDEGELDADGYLRIRGRIKEVINRGGEKIAPAEIDERLLAHPAVAQAVTFALPDARLGEEVAAAVVLAPTHKPDATGLQDFVSLTLAPFKVPRRIVFVDEIPKGPTGKIQRIGLAERLGVESAPESRSADHVAPGTTLERELAEIWSDVLQVSSVGLHDDFFALGGDSILGAEAVARIRDLTGQDDLPLVTIVQAPSIAAFAARLRSTVGALHGSGLIEIQAGGADTPVFFVHGVDGEVLRFVPLARRLGVSRPFYGLRALGIDDGAEPERTLEEMAAGYVERVRTVRPFGPYVLGGYCMGAPVALEMARLLRETGDQVNLVILVDPRFARPTSLRHALWLVPRRLRQGRLTAAVRGRLTPKRPGAVTGTERPVVEEALAAVREGYRPAPSTVPCAVVISADFERYELPEWYLRQVVRNPVQWTHVEGLHVDLFRPPAIDRLAADVRSALTLVERRATA